MGERKVSQNLDWQSLQLCPKAKIANILERFGSVTQLIDSVLRVGPSVDGGDGKSWQRQIGPRPTR
ncbi:MAG: hypothetical protein HC869_00540 [Rhodospirillales bacterium]|nr:hypothetical protein [Rhodospirillales bacterium]